MILVSACLAGRACRYDGQARPNAEIEKRIENGEAFHLACPECLAGLKIPREPAEIVGGDGYDVLDGKAKVMGKDGEDRTQAFLKGAQRFLKIAKEIGAKEVYLKKKSPSCGLGCIYDGSFTGTLIEGDGVTAALLQREGIQVKSY